MISALLSEAIPWLLGALAAVVGVFVARWRGRRLGREEGRKEVEHAAFKERERRAQTRQDVEQRVRNGDGDPADSLRERWSRD